MHLLQDISVKEQLIKLFPETKNQQLADHLGIPIYTLRRMAKKLGLSKSASFTKRTHRDAIAAKKEKQEKERKSYNVTRIQKNIIIGSLLGDGSLALYGRSKEAHYREHGCAAQDDYRRWKRDMLDSLDFKFSNNGKNGKLSSPSHPLYTDLYRQFYDATGKKVITEDIIKGFDHPIGLACLFMDDGTLVINSSSKKNRQKLYLFPTICIYTLNFTKTENLLLADHIQKTFGINFILKKHPDGYGYILFLSKRNEIGRFLEIISPYVKQIPCMGYKLEVQEKMQQTQERFATLNPQKQIILSDLHVIHNFYSEDDVALIITLKEQGFSNRHISKALGRSYWGITDKIRRLKKDGHIFS